MLRAAALTLSLVVAVPAWADDQTRMPEIEGIISGQMNAFKADDAEAAFGYASPAIRGIFRTSERFGTMVEEGYPMVWRPGEVRFLEARPLGRVVLQKVLIVDGAGALHVLEYEMVPSADSWAINGVRILREGQLGA